MDEKGLTTFDPAFDPANLTIKEMSFVANEIVQSKMFPDITSAHQAFVKILAGREMGITPFQAVAGMHIIQGKAVPGAGLLAAAVKGSGKYDYRVKTQTDKVCEIEFYQRIGDKLEPIGVSKFTIEDARKAGTKNLDKFAANMLFARAMSNGVKWYTPDATNGPVYVEGEIVEAEVVSHENPTMTPVNERDEAVGEPEPISEAEVVFEPEAPMGEYPPEPGLSSAEMEALFTPNPITDKQRRAIYAIINGAGVPRDEQKDMLGKITEKLLGTRIESSTELSKEDAGTVIDDITKGGIDKYLEPPF